MSISYKPLVERFEIPRPTLIEWQKRAEGEKENWRVKHLDFLRVQLIVEKETLEEIKNIAAPNEEDLFVLSVYCFFHNIVYFVPKVQLRQGLRDFSLHVRSGVEYQHEFATRIWSLRMGEESSKKMVNYYRIFDVIQNLSSAQYALLLNLVIDFVKITKKRHQIETKTFLEGKTWQELHTYDKAFSLKSIHSFFGQKGLLDM